MAIRAALRRSLPRSALRLAQARLLARVPPPSAAALAARPAAAGPSKQSLSSKKSAKPSADAAVGLKTSKEKAKAPKDHTRSQPSSSSSRSDGKGACARQSPPVCLRPHPRLTLRRPLCHSPQLVRRTTSVWFPSAPTSRIWSRHSRSRRRTLAARRREPPTSCLTRGRRGPRQRCQLRVNRRRRRRGRLSLNSRSPSTLTSVSVPTRSASTSRRSRLTPLPQRPAGRRLRLHPRRRLKPSCGSGANGSMTGRSLARPSSRRRRRHRQQQLVSTFRPERPRPRRALRRPRSRPARLILDHQPQPAHR
jgi:hypothetical protein